MWKTRDENSWKISVTLCRIRIRFQNSYRIVRSIGIGTGLKHKTSKRLYLRFARSRRRKKINASIIYFMSKTEIRTGQFLCSYNIIVVCKIEKRRSSKLSSSWIVYRRDKDQKYSAFEETHEKNARLILYKNKFKRLLEFSSNEIPKMR